MSENNNQEKKQHTPEFESCIANVIEQGQEKPSAFAICTKAFQDAGKPLFVGEAETQKLHLFSESIKLEGHKVSGVAIHPKKIFHQKEGMTHVYLKEELERAAPTLVGKPFGMDHVYPLPPPNLITSAHYDHTQNGVAFEGLVDDKIARQIQDKTFKGISVEAEFKPGSSVEFVEMNGLGAVPRHFTLRSVHFLKHFPPGDKEAFIKLWNGIQEQLSESTPKPLDQRMQNLEGSVGNLKSFVETELGSIKGQLKGMTSTVKPEDLKTAIKEALLEIKPQLQEAERDTAYINDLPDSAFAVIGSGGEKDDQSRTTPRTLRHLPHHKTDGSLDIPHLRNALARLPQTDLSAEDKASAQKHLCAHAKESEIVSEVCGEKPPSTQESQEMVSLRKKLVEAEAKLADAQKQVKQTENSLSQKYTAFREAIEKSIPPNHIWGAWTPGPKRLIQEQLQVLRESSK